MPILNGMKTDGHISYVKDMCCKKHEKSRPIFVNVSCNKDHLVVHPSQLSSPVARSYMIQPFRSKTIQQFRD